MSGLPHAALAAGLLWILACAAWFTFTVRKARVAPGSGSGSHGYPGRYPGLLLNGIGLVALTAVVSAIQYIATNYRYFWGGAWVFFIGLVLIAYHFILARRPADWVRRSTATTFREKSIVVQIVLILAVYGYFGARLWGFWDQPSLSTGIMGTITAVGALISITVCMIIIGVASHIALALYAWPESPDERDRVIGLRGSRNAYGTLAAGVWCVLFLAIAGIPHGALFFAIMGVIAVAELVRLGSQLFYYRFGA